MRHLSYQVLGIPRLIGITGVTVCSTCPPSNTKTSLFSSISLTCTDGITNLSGWLKQYVGDMLIASPGRKEIGAGVVLETIPLQNILLQEQNSLELSYGVYSIWYDYESHFTSVSTRLTGTEVDCQVSWHRDILQQEWVVRLNRLSKDVERLRWNPHKIRTYRADWKAVSGKNAPSLSKRVGIKWVARKTEKVAAKGSESEREKRQKTFIARYLQVRHNIYSHSLK